MATDSTFVDDTAETPTEPAAVDDEPPAVSVADIDGLETADETEAAAIAAAIAAHLRDRQAAAAAAAAATADDDSDSRRSWTFVGRLEAIGQEANRPPNGTPTDGWTAASRADRF